VLIFVDLFSGVLSKSSIIVLYSYYVLQKFAEVIINYLCNIKHYFFTSGKFTHTSAARCEIYTFGGLL
jgi:hypothetical protein